MNSTGLGTSQASLVSQPAPIVQSATMQTNTARSASSSSSSSSSSVKKESGPGNGKKTKGRVRIKMEFIHNKLRRYTTFSKRKTGIMKKAFELATLTGTQVMLLVASETGHVYTFATRKLQPMITSEAGKALIQTCLNSSDLSDNMHGMSSSSLNSTSSPSAASSSSSTSSSSNSTLVACPNQAVVGNSSSSCRMSGQDSSVVTTSNGGPTMSLTTSSSYVQSQPGQQFMAPNEQQHYQRGQPPTPERGEPDSRQATVASTGGFSSQGIDSNVSQEQLGHHQHQQQQQQQQQPHHHNHHQQQTTAAQQQQQPLTNHQQDQQQHNINHQQHHQQQQQQQQQQMIHLNVGSDLSYREQQQQNQSSYNSCLPISICTILQNGSTISSSSSNLISSAQAFEQSLERQDEQIMIVCNNDNQINGNNSLQASLTTQNNTKNILESTNSSSNYIHDLADDCGGLFVEYQTQRTSLGDSTMEELNSLNVTNCDPETFEEQLSFSSQNECFPNSVVHGNPIVSERTSNGSIGINSSSLAPEVGRTCNVTDELNEFATNDHYLNMFFMNNGMTTLSTSENTSANNTKTTSNLDNNHNYIGADLHAQTDLMHQANDNDLNNKSLANNNNNNNNNNNKLSKSTTVAVKIPRKKKTKLVDTKNNKQQQNSEDIQLTQQNKKTKSNSSKNDKLVRKECVFAEKEKKKKMMKKLVDDDRQKQIDKDSVQITTQNTNKSLLPKNKKTNYNGKKCQKRLGDSGQNEACQAQMNQSNLCLKKINEFDDKNLNNIINNNFDPTYRLQLSNLSKRLLMSNAFNIESQQQPGIVTTKTTKTTTMSISKDNKNQAACMVDQVEHNPSCVLNSSTISTSGIKELVPNSSTIPILITTNNTNLSNDNNVQQQSHHHLMNQSQQQQQQHQQQKYVQQQQQQQQQHDQYIQQQDSSTCGGTIYLRTTAGQQLNLIPIQSSASNNCQDQQQQRRYAVSLVNLTTNNDHTAVQTNHSIPIKTSMIAQTIPQPTTTIQPINDVQQQQMIAQSTASISRTVDDLPILSTVQSKQVCLIQQQQQQQHQQKPRLTHSISCGNQTGNEFRQLPTPLPNKHQPHQVNEISLQERQVQSSKQQQSTIATIMSHSTSSSLSSPTSVCSSSFSSSSVSSSPLSISPSNQTRQVPSVHMKQTNSNTQINNEQQFVNQHGKHCTIDGTLCNHQNSNLQIATTQQQSINQSSQQNSVESYYLIQRNNKQCQLSKAARARTQVELNNTFTLNSNNNQMTNQYHNPNSHSHHNQQGEHALL